MDRLHELSDAELQELRDSAEDYETRSKIRAELRARRGGGRRPTGTTEYRRPGFQAPKLVTIPNSVTGNVLASKTTVGGPAPKPPSKDTPTIGYLGSSTVVTPASRGSRNSSSGTSTFQSVVPKDSDQQQWWHKSTSSSRTPSQSSSRHDVLSPQATTPEPQEEVRSHSQRESSVSSEPLKEPSPEPVREPSPSPEPPREPSPQPPTPSPEPVREPTPSPSPEPIREPSPEPEPLREPSPEPLREPSPEPVFSDAEEEEEDIPIADDQDEEEGQHTRTGGKDRKPPAGAKAVVLPEAMKHTEPGMEEEIDFRKKLKEAKASKIDTKAAFPQAKPKGAQIDFRDVLRRATGPEKKEFKSGSKAQLDFRDLLRKPDSQDRSRGNTPDPDQERSPSVEHGKEEEEQELEPEPEEPAQEEPVEEEPEPPKVDVVVQSPPPPKAEEIEEDSYEARRERRRREREARYRQPSEEASKPLTNGLEEQRTKTPETTPEVTAKSPEVNDETPEVTAEVTVTSPEVTAKTPDIAFEEDSYEARREARRKAREERMKKALEEGSGSKSKLTYRQQQAQDQAKRLGDNRKKWEEKDQANSNGTEKQLTRQKSSGAQRGAQQLLAWCQHKTRYYENVEVNDFSSSWANGLALCAILHSFLPDNIPYDDLSPTNRRQNFTVALQAAEDAQIGSFFDVEDLMAVKAPDPKSMMTFLATIYQHFK